MILMQFRGCDTQLDHPMLESSYTHGIIHGVDTVYSGSTEAAAEARSALRRLIGLM